VPPGRRLLRYRLRARDRDPELDRDRVPDLDDEARLRGTLAPARRASERPMAMACFRLVTFFPEPPLRKVPRFRSLITLATFS
jgi:hypothetical protein